ncbi:MAG TPA: ribose-5-phosphate isomerase RpiA [Stellaceae bacterium]|nr:ribose-5-phosphate isomerase RpiA [Stellaceae bacterium]
MTTETLKRAAAERAAAEVADGMTVGLGSGTTAAFVIEALARRVAQGLRIVCVPTSERTANLARRLGLALVGLTDRPVDIDIDGADQVERASLVLVKGGGGSLLREKIVALASRRMVVAVDETKLVDRLGPGTIVPVEIEPWGAAATLVRLANVGAAARLRYGGTRPFVTDGGHVIADCTFDGILDPRALETRLNSIAGVIECGLFVGLASEVVVGREHAVEVIAR